MGNEWHAFNEPKFVKFQVLVATNQIEFQREMILAWRIGDEHQIDYLTDSGDIVYGPYEIEW